MHKMARGSRTRADPDASPSQPKTHTRADPDAGSPQPKSRASQKAMTKRSQPPVVLKDVHTQTKTRPHVITTSLTNVNSRSFTYTWKLATFAYRLATNPNCTEIPSARFPSSKTSEYAFQMMCYPHGCDREHAQYMSLGIRFLKLPYEYASFCVGMRMHTAEGSHGFALTSATQRALIGTDAICKEFFPIQTMLDSPSIYYPGDTLTIGVDLVILDKQYSVPINSLSSSVGHCEQRRLKLVDTNELTIEPNDDMTQFYTVPIRELRVVHRSYWADMERLCVTLRIVVSLFNLHDVGCRLDYPLAIAKLLTILLPDNMKTSASQTVVTTIDTEKTVCGKCLSKIAIWMAQPCNHVCLCEPCMYKSRTNRRAQCPTCKQCIVQYIRPRN